MFYVLTALAHGDSLGEFDSLEAAEAALDRVIAADPSAADEVGIVAFDETGAQHGAPITRAAA
jgi:hypothetical protein